ncbi:MAG: hypothetical protein MMC23_003824 [Stictis urceolatum]|nr:hypothetical protein [Stictis urceolata]
MQPFLLRSCFKWPGHGARPSDINAPKACWVPQNGQKIGLKKHWQRTLLTRAYRAGPKEPPLIEQTIPEHFDGIVRQYGNRPAVISHHQNQTVTYRELQEKSNAIAHGLQSIGVKKGDRVAVSMGNCMEFAIVTYSLFRLGAILVPLNPAFTSSQVTAALNHLSVSHLIISAETALPYNTSVPNLPLLQALIADPESTILKSTTVPCLTQIVVADTASRTSPSPLSILKPLIPFTALTTTFTAPRPVPPLSPHDTINIQFTSGTTSTPKAAQLSHHNILNNGHSIGARLGLSPSDLICCPPPLFHCFGCVLGYMATATHGSCIVFPAPAFDPASTLAAVAQYQCTGLYGVPTMFNAELALLDSGALEVPEEGFARLTKGIAAGSSIPAELMRKLHRRMGLRDLAICYGMTETSPVSAMTGLGDGLEKRVETVGRVMSHVEVKVVDPGTGETKGVGERGELWVSGYVLMKGYWGDERRTEEAFARERDEGGREKVWMKTGDEGSMDQDGYVRITGRIKDLIIRGGENVHPLEIEDCVLGMQSVGDVSVVGVKDERYGEVVAAFVIRGGKGEGVKAEEVREWVRGRLSRHLIPKYVFFTETFPKTASGKVQKFALREEAERMVRGGKGLD